MIPRSGTATIPSRSGSAERTGDRGFKSSRAVPVFWGTFGIEDHLRPRTGPFCGSTAVSAYRRGRRLAQPRRARPRRGRQPPSPDTRPTRTERSMAALRRLSRGPRPGRRGSLVQRLRRLARRFRLSGIPDRERRAPSVVSVWKEPKTTARVQRRCFPGAGQPGRRRQLTAPQAPGRGRRHRRGYQGPGALSGVSRPPGPARARVKLVFGQDAPSQQQDRRKRRLAGAFNIVMRIFSSLLGLLAIFMGLVWIGQGLHIGPAAIMRGFMVSNPQWALYLERTPILALLGVGQVIWSTPARARPLSRPRLVRCEVPSAGLGRDLGRPGRAALTMVSVVGQRLYAYSGVRAAGLHRRPWQADRRRPRRYPSSPKARSATSTRCRSPCRRISRVRQGVKVVARIVFFGGPFRGRTSSSPPSPSIGRTARARAPDARRRPVEARTEAQPLRRPRVVRLRQAL